MVTTNYDIKMSTCRMPLVYLLPNYELMIEAREVTIPNYMGFLFQKALDFLRTNQPSKIEEILEQTYRLERASHQLIKKCEIR